MKVLLTGAFGNVGRYTIDELLKKGYKVTCYDIKTKDNLKASKLMPQEVDVIWGDLKTGENLEAATKNQDIVIHLAFIIPPLSEKNPKLAYQINVGGVEKIVEAIKTQKKVAKLIFTSTIAVFGNSQDLVPPRKIGDLLNPVDNYGKQKIECEDIIRKSGVKYSILRVAATPSINWRRVDPIMFDVPLTDRIEFVHPGDVACALANAVIADDIWGKTLLIGGGQQCQMYQKEFMEKALSILGVGMLPNEAFSKKPYHTDWMDTEESQRLLSFQDKTYDQFLTEQAKIFGIRAFLVKVFRPIIRWYLLFQSPYYQKYISSKGKIKKKRTQTFIKKVAVETNVAASTTAKPSTASKTIMKSGKDSGTSKDTKKNIKQRKK